ncbi:4-hydroxy-tetrahydrodipicolinate synthase [Phyllobacterium sp. OV277]|uniref:4-hydroxy-tetrahydrodipicolinate synthase n=1 Tax=Phyllobacterium sp. OV277 TaxID=1882772 RepID=UPI00088C6D95|nr:4-hydroxy-tetrahydrodipicolinate synthase [Phyllobacterium sp. OV277]SDO71791.1 dihydrodipicolinate synthase [Phyllobacterium sp. OV277]
MTNPIPPRLSGIMTALVTPFKNGVVDHDTLAEHIQWQIMSGIEGLVPCGTTGEAPTLSWDERLKIIRTTIRVSKGRVPVIAGTGTNSTELTVAYTSAAESRGADAALVVTPYYNKPSQNGIAHHFETIAQRVKLPIFIYNVPSRTGVDLSLQTLDRLAQIPSIIGIKDATGDIRRVDEVRHTFQDRFILLSGHDATAHAFNLTGGDGSISVIANVLPHVCVAMHNACRKNDWPTARYIQQRLQPVLSALDLDTNPCSIKSALKHRRGMSDELRLPLVPVSGETALQIRLALDELGGPAAGGQIPQDNVKTNAVEGLSKMLSAPLAWRL